MSNKVSNILGLRKTLHFVSQDLAVADRRILFQKFKFDLSNYFDFIKEVLLHPFLLKNLCIFEYNLDNSFVFRESFLSKSDVNLEG